MADDATWYEGRTLHPDATRHDGADPDATRHEGTRPDPDATRHEGRQDGTPVGLARFGHLPPRLASRFDFVRALSTAGGQADIVLCRDRASGEEVAVKIYRGHPQIDHAMYDKLRLVEAAHVAPTLELHTDAEATWEVQEYFRFGSLHDLLRERGDGAQRPQFVRAVVVELAAALRALHAEGISHRDLKPGNVFVRSVDPLDLVLGDFGFARDLAMSSEYMSVVGVFHYTAPEVALGGLASPAGDWWALGIIVYELLTGHSLFLDDAGRREANQYRVRGALDQGAYSIAEVTDPRWHLLLRGLLNSDRKNRWSDGQVDAWLAGASPEVVEAPPARVVRRAEPFTTPWGTFTEPDQALAAMIPDWGRACAYLTDAVGKPFAQWLAASGAGDTVARVVQAVERNDMAAGAGLVALQGYLLPSRAIRYRDRVVDGATLEDAARRAASGDVAAQKWIKGLRKERILATVAQHVTDGPRLAAVDESMAAFWRRLTSLLAAAEGVSGLRETVPAVRGALEGAALAASLDTGQSERYLSQGRAVASRLTSSDQHLLRVWAADVAQGSVPDALALSLLGATAVAEREARERAAADAQARREQDERDRAEQARLVQRRREARERVRAASRRILPRLGLTLLLFGVTAFFLVPRGSRLTALIDYATVPVVCIALAFVVESVFRLRPPPVAYWLGFASFLWAGFGTLTSVPASPGPAAGVWLAGLFAWFLGGYAVGYALGFALDRLLGSGRDTTDGRWLVLPAVSVLTVAVARVVAGFGQVGVQLGTAGLGANLAQAAVLPVVRDLPLTIMQPLALFTGFASLVALTTTRATSQLPTGRRRMLWGALNVAAGLVVAYWAPNLVMTLWILLGAALVMGMAAMAISAVTE